MRTQAEQETARQQRRLAKLIDERTKLLHAYYQGAIPLDLLHQEQDRIVGQITSAEAQLVIAQRSTTDVQSTLDKALDLLASCQDAYTNAPAHLRRQWNQALFLRLHVHDQDIQHADIAEPFATLANPTLATALVHHEKQPHKTRTRGGQDTAAVSNGGGSNKAQIVGAPRFELGTPCSQSRCATRLRHAPMTYRVDPEDTLPRSASDLPMRNLPELLTLLASASAYGRDPTTARVALRHRHRRPTRGRNRTAV